MDLDEKLKNEKGESKIAEAPSNIDNVVETAQPKTESVDDKLGLDEKTGILGVVWDIMKYTPLAIAQVLAFGPILPATTLITSTGFAIGGYFEAKKKKVKYTWKRLRRELYSGNIFGYLDYAIFKVPSFFANIIPYFGAAGALPKIAKTLFFEALVVPQAVAAYNSLEYIRDQMGWKKFFKNMITLRYKDTFNEIYQNAIKGKVWNGAKGIYKIAPPLHHIQLNYLPNMQLIMAQSAFVNNPIIRYILGKKTEKKKPEPVQQQENIRYMPQQNYQNQYRQAA
ncbi:hypothetical protein HQ529_06840 [Candidatus Woesearchaeota archaeon]|nr:hypothetical protein [Candidatus Woesearchaeota archaeon]